MKPLSARTVVILIWLFLLQFAVPQTATQDRETAMIATAATALKENLIETERGLGNVDFYLKFWEQSRIDDTVQAGVLQLLDGDFNGAGEYLYGRYVLFKILEDGMDGNGSFVVVTALINGTTNARTWVVTLDYDSVSREWQAIRIRNRAPGY